MTVFNQQENFYSDINIFIWIIFLQDICKSPQDNMNSL